MCGGDASTQEDKSQGEQSRTSKHGAHCGSEGLGAIFSSDSTVFRRKTGPGFAPAFWAQIPGPKNGFRELFLRTRGPRWPPRRPTFGAEIRAHFLNFRGSLITLVALGCGGGRADLGFACARPVSYEVSVPGKSNRTKRNFRGGGREVSVHVSDFFWFASARVRSTESVRLLAPGGGGEASLLNT